MQQQEELIVLRYAANACHLTVDEVCDVADLHIEDSHWRWSCDKKLYPIGKSRPLLHNSPREGVIGVYNRNEIDHWRNMVGATCEAIRGQYRTFTDD